MTTGLAKQLGVIERFFAKDVGLQFLPDLCDLIGPSQIEDGHSGHTVEDVTLISDIPCLIEKISAGPQAEADTVNATTTCRIHLKVTEAQALLIDQHKKLRVAARGANAEMIFEQPVRDTDSLSQLVIVTAILTNGYRRPGSI